MYKSTMKDMFTYVFVVLCLLKGSHNQDTSTATPSTTTNTEINDVIRTNCDLYGTESTCSAYHAGKYIHTLGKESMSGNEQKLSSMFRQIDMFTTVIQTGEDPLSSLSMFYMLAAMQGLNVERPSQAEMRLIIDIVKGETFDKCMQGVKELLCYNYLPPCKATTAGSYTPLRPCKDTCFYVQEDLCEAEKDLFSLLKSSGLFYSDIQCSELFNEDKGDCFKSEGVVKNSTTRDNQTTTKAPLTTNSITARISLQNQTIVSTSSDIISNNSTQRPTTFAPISTTMKTTNVNTTQPSFTTKTTINNTSKMSNTTISTTVYLVKTNNFTETSTESISTTQKPISTTQIVSTRQLSLLEKRCAPYAGNLTCSKYFSHDERVGKKYATTNERYLARLFGKIHWAKRHLRTARNPYNAFKMVFSVAGGRSWQLQRLNRTHFRQFVEIIRGPTFDRCLEHLQELFCYVYMPPCRAVGLYSYRVQQNCQEMCYLVEHEVCKNEQPLLKLLDENGLFKRRYKCSQFYKVSSGLCYVKNITENLPTVLDLDKYYNISDTLPSTTAQPTSIANKQNNSLCPLYDDVLPSGMCSGYMRGRRITQATQRATNVNRQLEVFYRESVPAMEIFFKGRKPWKLIKTGLGDCNITKSLRKKLRKLDYPSPEEFRQCIRETRELVCHMYHPTCLLDSNNGLTLPSPLCRESCSLFHGTCDRTVAIMRIFNEAKGACDALSKVNAYFFNHPECNMFPARGKSLFECQKLPTSKNAESADQFSSESDDCYDAKRQQYHGQVNTTESGLRCEAWAELPFHDINVYPDLTENYCRNPQGFRSRPWCYINAKDETWEYCSVLKCKRKKDRRLRLGTIVGSSVASLFVIAIIVGLVACKMTRTVEKESKQEAECAYETAIETARDVKCILTADAGPLPDSYKISEPSP